MAKSISETASDSRYKERNNVGRSKVSDPQEVEAISLIVPMQGQCLTYSRNTPYKFLISKPVTLVY